ncbi:MAG: hypothetical protein RR310_05145 [Eubacterium sp.]
MKDQEIEKVQSDVVERKEEPPVTAEKNKEKPKKKSYLKTKVILFVLGIAILLVVGMVMGIRFSFAMQASALYLQKIFTWLIFILIILAIIAIPIAWKVYKYRKNKENDD